MIRANLEEVQLLIAYLTLMTRISSSNCLKHRNRLKFANLDLKSEKTLFFYQFFCNFLVKSCKLKQDNENFNYEMNLKQLTIGIIF